MKYLISGITTAIVLAVLSQFGFFEQAPIVVVLEIGTFWFLGICLGEFSEIRKRW